MSYELGILCFIICSGDKIMFIGQNTRPKNEIIFYLIITLLIDGSVDSNDIKIKFNISTKTFVNVNFKM